MPEQMTQEQMTQEQAFAAKIILSDSENLSDSAGFTLVEGVYAYNGLLDQLQALSDRYVSRSLFITSHQQWLRDNPADPNNPADQKASLVRSMVKQAERQQQSDLSEEVVLLNQIGCLFWDLMNTPEFDECFEKGPVRFPGGLSLHGKPVDLHTLIWKQ